MPMKYIKFVRNGTRSIKICYYSAFRQGHYRPSRPPRPMHPAIHLPSQGLLPGAKAAVTTSSCCFRAASMLRIRSPYDSKSHMPSSGRGPPRVSSSWSMSKYLLISAAGIKNNKRRA